jgi:hypothetical protein
MADEILVIDDAGLSVYVIIFDIDNKVWNNMTSSFETATAANWGDYAVELTDATGIGLYFGNFPTGIGVMGDYPVVPYVANTPGIPAAGDSPVVGAKEVMHWSGSSELEISGFGPTDMVTELYNSFVVNTTTFQKVLQGLAAINLGHLTENAAHSTSEFADVNDPGTVRARSTNTTTTREVTLI